ncbi:hypothetical protein BDZ45DRAFT_753769 [Acephala macrosclerotiorum]|nr:hypothetical protein BDZ45DRAFT_753769 [Acephala macrosclerotiorum]
MPSTPTPTSHRHRHRASHIYAHLQGNICCISSCWIWQGAFSQGVPLSPSEIRAKNEKKRKEKKRKQEKRNHATESLSPPYSLPSRCHDPGCTQSPSQIRAMLRRGTAPSGLDTKLWRALWAWWVLGGFVHSLNAGRAASLDMILGSPSLLSRRAHQDPATSSSSTPLLLTNTKTYHTLAETRPSPINTVHTASLAETRNNSTVRTFVCRSHKRQDSATRASTPHHTSLCEPVQLSIQPRRFDQVCEWTHNRIVPQVFLHFGLDS